MEQKYILDSFTIIEVEACNTLPIGDDFRKVIVEIDGRKVAIWTTESNLKAIEFDQQSKNRETASESSPKLPCIYCSGASNLLADEHSPGTTVAICEDELTLYSHENENANTTVTDVKIRFCPICGRLLNHNK